MLPDYEGFIYTAVLLLLYFCLLGVSVLVFHFYIPVVIALHQIALVSLSVMLGVFLVRKFRKNIYSFVSVITQTNLVPVAPASAVAAAATSLDLVDPTSTAAALGLEMFTGEPNF